MWERKMGLWKEYQTKKNPSPVNESHGRQQPSILGMGIPHYWCHDGGGPIPGCHVSEFKRWGHPKLQKAIEMVELGN